MEHIFFLWPSETKVEEKIDVVQGLDWWAEYTENSGKSYEISDITKIDSHIIVMYAKKMPENWMGESQINTKLLGYKQIRSDRLFEWDVIGPWNRILVKNIEGMPPSIEALWSKCRNWTNNTMCLIRNG